MRTESNRSHLDTNVQTHAPCVGRGDRYCDIAVERVRATETVGQGRADNEAVALDAEIALTDGKISMGHAHCKHTLSHLYRPGTKVRTLGSTVPQKRNVIRAGRSGLG